jgi:hypothetical protein
MGTKLKAKWMCNGCGDIHDDEDSAIECCPPTTLEVYVCPVCGDDHRKEADALDCCGYDEDAPPPPPSAAELEAVGQLRLIE